MKVKELKNIKIKRVSRNNSYQYYKLKIMNDVFTASVSYNKSESKSSVHNETVEKSSLVSGNNMNIKSKNGSINISGTDVKVGNDLDLSAKKDITIKASEEIIHHLVHLHKLEQVYQQILKKEEQQIYQYHKQEQELEEMEQTI